MRTKDIRGYHETTKHHPYRYARSPGYLEWSSEPEPFRRYEGAPLIRLPLARQYPEGTFADLMARKGGVVRHFSFENIACFLELSLGLSAWKSYGDNFWALRVNPSSGNLHPVESYLVLPPLPHTAISGGIYHYNSFFHALEQRASIDKQFWVMIRQLFPDGFFAALSSIHWREAWKYGERAFRYSHLDMGHAIAALSYSAALLGWKVTYLNALSDRDVEIILGFNKTAWRKFEQEESGPLVFVHSDREQQVSREIPADLIRFFDSLSFIGEPNVLSTLHQNWSVIDEASDLTTKLRTSEGTFSNEQGPCIEIQGCSAAAAEVIRGRRSALALDAKTALAADRFFAILDSTLPRNCAPFDVGLHDPSIHLLVFIHRVIGLEPGLYFLIRGNTDVLAIQQNCRQGFLWKRAPEATSELPLYVLEHGDFRSAAQSASCDQDIAADGAFAIAMISEFSQVEREPYRYRLLHWEAGMIGQVLYLGAEACGIRGTGMGCFFDDRTHDILGLQDDTLQDLYHFAAGAPVEDTRLTTLPPYHHLERMRQS